MPFAILLDSVLLLLPHLSSRRILLYIGTEHRIELLFDWPCISFYCAQSLHCQLILAALPPCRFSPGTMTAGSSNATSSVLLTPIKKSTTPTTSTPTRLERTSSSRLGTGSNGTTPVVARKQPQQQAAVDHPQASPLIQMSEAPNGSANRRNNNINSTNHLAYTIVWSPLPIITWFIPFIGHTGICDSSGVASDFQGPYFVGDDGRMAFGAPTRSLKIDMDATSSSIGLQPTTPITSLQWDDAIQQANEVYRGRMHNICCDNCHSHVAYALNRMPVSAYGIQSWNMINIAAVVFFRANFLSWSGVLKQFLPFTIFVLLCVVIAT